MAFIVFLISGMLIQNRCKGRSCTCPQGIHKGCNYSVPLFEKEGLGEILLDKSPSIPLFQRGR